MPPPQNMSPVFTSKNSFSLGKARSGMCFAMTCNWIKLAKQHGIKGSAQVMAPNQLLFASIVHAGYKNMINTGMDTNRRQEKLVYKQYGLKVLASVSISDFDKITQSEVLQNDPYFFEFELPGHSVGLCLSESEQCVYFFDPNYGCYRLTLDRVNDFFLYLYDEYVEEDGHLDECAINYVVLTVPG